MISPPGVELGDHQQRKQQAGQGQRQSSVRRSPATASACPSGTLAPQISPRDPSSHTAPYPESQRLADEHRSNRDNDDQRQGSNQQAVNLDYLDLGFWDPGIESATPLSPPDPILEFINLPFSEGLDEANMAVPDNPNPEHNPQNDMESWQIEHGTFAIDMPLGYQIF
jgi:hypothetical protein